MPAPGPATTYPLTAERTARAAAGSSVSPPTGAQADGSKRNGIGFLRCGVAQEFAEPTHQAYQFRGGVAASAAVVISLTARRWVPKQKVLEMSRGEWVEQHTNCCLIGNAGTGKTHLATALGLAVCRLGRRVRFVTAANLVTQLEEAQQQHRLERMLTQLDRVDLLVIDELGYLSFSRTGAELLFQVFADRYERRSVLVTSNLAFSEWGTVFQGDRMTAALLDRLTHRCEIFEMNGESFRFRESMTAKKQKDPKKGS